MERKLASIQKILDLQDVPNSDTLQVATILGWKSVVKKDEFQVGDFVVYVEYDSIVPPRSEFDFLQERNYRVKTVRLRGQVSQGLVMPLTILPNYNLTWEGFSTKYGMLRCVEGMDVTGVLDIIKYEPPVKGNLTEVKGNFPQFIKKTDEMRVQAVPQVLERHKGKQFYVTEKLDGTSMTVYFKDGQLGVCSRNMELIDTSTSKYWNMVRQLKLDKTLLSFGQNIALQGELIGEGIQKNKYQINGNKFYLFNIFDIDKFERIRFGDMCIASSRLNLDMVPIVNFSLVLKHNVDELVEFSKGKSQFADIQREGLVFKSVIPEQDEDLEDLSFKVINPSFLLKHDE